MTHYVNWLDIDKKAYYAHKDALAAENEGLAEQNIGKEDEYKVYIDTDSMGHPAESIMKTLLKFNVPFKMYSSGGVMGFQFIFKFDGKDFATEDITDPDPLGFFEEDSEYTSSETESSEEKSIELVLYDEEKADDGVPF